MAAAALGTALSLILVAPWSSSNRPIRHALYDRVNLAVHQLPPARVDLATGGSVPLESTNEIFYDRRTGLYRLKSKLGSWVAFDGVGDSCPRGVTKKACLKIVWVSPFMEADRYRSAFEDGRARKLGTGVVDGHRVIWVEIPYRGKTNLREHAALDAETHALRAVRQLVGGRPLWQLNVTLLADLPGGSIDFPVPKGGAVWNSVPPVLPTEMDLGPDGLSAARRALSPPPLWVGRHFSGYKLSLVETGAAKVKDIDQEITLASAPYVRISYRAPHRRELVLEEFNSSAGAFLRNQLASPPRAGYLYLYEGQSYGVLTRNGVVVRITAPNRQVAVDVARALKPIPATG